MSKRNKKYLLLMIYIYCFIFISFGVVFSYFTANARSNNNALSVKSGSLFLSLQVESKYSGHKLIPLADSDIMKAYYNGCVDDYGNGACVAYSISIVNDSIEQEVIGTIDFDIDHINNLCYLVLDENENIYQNITKIEKSTMNMPLGSNFVLGSALESGVSTKRDFVLLIWLSDFDYNQVEDRDGSFSASIRYNSIYGQRLSSSVSVTGESGD